VSKYRGGLTAGWRQLPTLRGEGKGGEKSAEDIAGGLYPAEGLNMNDVEGNRGFDDEGETE
jgi:hypothetical protein